MSYPTFVPNIGAALAERIDTEVKRSEKHGTGFPSLHEAYAVILEEVDELWDITRQKRRDRVLAEIEIELIRDRGDGPSKRCIRPTTL